MADVIKFVDSMESPSNAALEKIPGRTDIAEVATELLEDARSNISKTNSISLPLTQLTTLGMGVSSLLPAMRTVTQTMTVNTDGLFQLANAAVGDTLKVAKNGNFWGAFKTADGTSKFAQLKAAGPLSASNTTMIPVDPATMMMAVALFSIEKQLGDIEAMQRQIISFLEVEKESEIEADVETLTSIIKKYKHNWDNEHFIVSNHKLVLDIQRTMRKHLNSYQKKIADFLNSKKMLIAQGQVNTALDDLQKKFKYYRLSVYTFSLASLIEIMLSGNFREEYISDVRDEVERISSAYRELFKESSVYLEKLSGSAFDTNVLKSIGKASNTIGKIIGAIPVIQKGPVDEFLQESGKQLQENTGRIAQKVLKTFAEISNPETGVFVDKMNDLIQIYNHTDKIYFDDKKIYLVAG